MSAHNGLKRALSGKSRLRHESDVFKRIQLQCYRLSDVSIYNAYFDEEPLLYVIDDHKNWSQTVVMTLLKRMNIKTK